jgi:hypothetical protein
MPLKACMAREREDLSLPERAGTQQNKPGTIKSYMTVNGWGQRYSVRAVVAKRKKSNGLATKSGGSG